MRRIIRLSELGVGIPAFQIRSSWVQFLNRCGEVSDFGRLGLASWREHRPRKLAGVVSWGRVLRGAILFRSPSRTSLLIHMAATWATAHGNADSVRMRPQ